jgi:hypothetical protein
MRLTIIGVLAATLTAGACSRADTAAAAAGNAVATTGRTDAASAAAPAARPSTSSARPEPVGREITIPAGTSLSVILDTPVGSDTSRVEERVSAHLARPVVVHGETALAEGSRIGGVVTDAKRSGKVKGRAHVAVRFDSLSPSGGDERYTIQTSAIGRTAPGTKKKDALEIGAPAAGGAVIGALLGGKKGAAIGGAVGGGAGTAVVLSTRGKEVHLAKGSAVTLRLTQPVTIRVRG